MKNLIRLLLSGLSLGQHRTEGNAKIGGGGERHPEFDADARLNRVVLAVPVGDHVSERQGDHAVVLSTIDDQINKDRLNSLRVEQLNLAISELNRAALHPNRSLTNFANNAGQFGVSNSFAKAGAAA